MRDKHRPSQDRSLPHHDIRANLQRGRRLADGTSDNTKKTRVIEALGLDDVSQLSFRRFLDYLESIDLSRGDSHLMRQVQVYELEGLRQPVVCRLESLAADVAAFNKETGQGFDPEGLTSTHHAAIDPEKGQFAGDLTWAEMEGTLPQYWHFYDTESLERVTNLYRDDIETYGYEFPWPEVI